MRLTLGIRGHALMGGKGTVHVVAVLVASVSGGLGLKKRWIKNRCRGAEGGRISSKLQSELVNVTKIYSSDEAFAALRSDGTVRAWGHPLSMLP